ncbi:hypothetical protein SERLA73DRAFT_66576, partial [Serpula lacrymans var. lacrymans S7.3]
YWQHFCKLVKGICLANQHQITQQDLKDIYMSLLDFVQGFETLYYQCRPDCLHFI